MENRISCVRTGVQPGLRRSHDANFPPVIKSWRCELTALSHTYNLYFVACNETIYIFEPSFPCQDLGFIENGYALHPPQSAPNLIPHIDPDDPHSITRLHVDYLGTDEVVIVTCDDGDVVVYRVPDIFRAMEKRRTSLPDNQMEADLDDEVRVFRHINVGSSAWGIAVHREARLMAISANTHNITVLAFALSDPSDDSSSEIDRGFPHDRKRDQDIVLRGTTNIPALSFDNTNSHGRWLVSSSINGNTHIWDLHNPRQPARVITLGVCVSVGDPKVSPQICQCSNRTSVPHAAWAALFIDPRACHRVSTLREACGSGYRATGPVRIEPCFWDITETEHRYTSTRIGPLPAPSDDFDANSENYDEIPLSELTDSDETGSLESDQMSIDSAEEPAQTSSDAENAIIQQPQGEPQSPLSNNPTPGSSLLIPYSDSSESEEDEDNLTFVITDATGQAALQVFYPPAPDPDPSSDPPKYPYCSIYTSQHFLDQSKARLPRTESSDISGGPLVIITKEEIYLFQRPFQPQGDYSDPVMFMRNPLFPITTPATGSRGPIPPYHRHCYATQIPELGIFIVATPAGRVGIFSLTRAKHEFTEKVLFGFRLSAILPCKGDDGRKRADGAKNVIADVWGKRLVGIAVGPVQGMLDEEGGGGGAAATAAHGISDDEDDGEEQEEGGEGGKERVDAKVGPRRWRLIMQFHDHTVYSYELGKQLGSGVSGLGDLVV
ncbi:hypothetical protein DM02DRAFT_729695 [Periconia macrospinosa]|uniref:WD40 repeat-like protein n=1 Tax=Periconia macrospinosa TaxID=97972 RepID=A0A2V1DN88_9PLEO|nr:hypothetical protein DM02DRAFT_729695 [Periconia macrospinosa]